MRFNVLMRALAAGGFFPCATECRALFAATRDAATPLPPSAAAAAHSEVEADARVAAARAEVAETKAQKHLYAAQPAALAEGDWYLAKSYLALGAAYEARGAWDRAIGAFKLSKEVCERGLNPLCDAIGRAEALCGVARCLARSARFVESFATFRDALELTARRYRPATHVVCNCDADGGGTVDAFHTLWEKCFVTAYTAAEVGGGAAAAYVAIVPDALDPAAPAAVPVDVAHAIPVRSSFLLGTHIFFSCSSNNVIDRAAAAQLDQAHSGRSVRERGCEGVGGRGRRAAARVRRARSLLRRRRRRSALGACAATLRRSV